MRDSGWSLLPNGEAAGKSATFHDVAVCMLQAGTARALAALQRAALQGQDALAQVPLEAILNNSIDSLQVGSSFRRSFLKARAAFRTMRWCVRFVRQWHIHDEGYGGAGKPRSRTLLDYGVPCNSLASNDVRPPPLPDDCV